MRRLEGRARQYDRKTPLFGVVIAMLLLTGCSTDDGADPTLTAQSTAASASPSPARISELDPVVWTTEINESTNAPGSRLETFTRDEDIIYAVVSVSRMPAGTTLTATWAFNDKLLDGFTSNVTVDESLTEGFIEFHLSWKGETYWPRGTLSINITASTGQVTSSSVEIQ